MKCPYCGKRVGDMPDHLRKTKVCHEKHVENLDYQIRHVFRRRTAVVETQEVCMEDIANEQIESEHKLPGGEACNCGPDWETGIIDGYDLEFYKVEGEKKDG